MKRIILMLISLMFYTTKASADPISAAIGLGTFLSAGAATGVTAGILGTGALISGGLSIASGVKSLLSKPQQQQQQRQQSGQATQSQKGLPAVPKIEDSKAKAREAVAKRQKIIARTGGKTQVTTGLETVPEVNIGRKSLIGQ